MRRSELLRLAGEMDAANPHLDVRRRTRLLAQFWRPGSAMRKRLEFDDEAGAPISYVRAVRAAADYCAGPPSVSAETEAEVVSALLPWPGGVGYR